jgi:hypothetical protein
MPASWQTGFCDRFARAKVADRRFSTKSVYEVPASLDSIQPILACEQVFSTSVAAMVADAEAPELGLCLLAFCFPSGQTRRRAHHP